MRKTEQSSVIWVLTCLLTISAVLAQPPSIKSCIATTTELAKKEIKALVRDQSLDWGALFDNYRSYLNTAIACEGVMLTKIVSVNPDCNVMLNNYKLSLQNLRTRVTASTAAQTASKVEGLGKLIVKNCDFLSAPPLGIIRKK